MSEFIIRRIASKHYDGVYLRVDGKGITQFQGSGAGKVSIGHGAGPAEQFKIRKAPTDGSAYITGIESLSYPGVYIRMDGSSVKEFVGRGSGVVNLQFGQGDYEKFKVVNNSDGSVSFESTTYPKVFLGIRLHKETGETHPIINCQYCKSGPGFNETFELQEIPEQMNIRVLSYNVHLMKDSFIEDGASVKRKIESEPPLVFEDDTRRDLIVHKTIATLADVICFQEIWDLNWETYMKDRMLETYPYWYLGPNSSRMIGIYKATSGVVVLSKFELSERYVEEFTGLDFSEGMSSKGILCATVSIPLVGKIRLGTTHASTDTGGPACRELALLAEHTTKKSHKEMAALYLGDFNAHPNKYPVQKKIFTFPDSGMFAAVDCWKYLYEGEWYADGRTIDMRNNTLDQFFSPKRGTAPPSVIDYIWARQGNEIGLIPKKVTITRDWKYNSGKWYFAHPAESLANACAAAGPDSLCVVYHSYRQTHPVEVHNIRTVVFNKNDGSWKHGNANCNTRTSPGVVFFGGKFRLFYRHFHGKGIVVRSSVDGFNWGDETYTGHDTGGSVYPIVFQDKLHVFYVDPDGEGGMVFYMIKKENDDNWGLGSFSDRYSTGITTARDMSVVVYANLMCVVTREGKSTGGIMRSVLMPDGKWDWGRAGSLSASGSPAIVYLNEWLHLFYRDPNGDGILTTRSKDGFYWEDGIRYTGHDAAAGPVAAASWENKMMLFYSVDRNIHGGFFSDYTMMHTVAGEVPVDLSDHYPVLADIEIRKRSVMLNVSVHLKDVGGLLFTDGQWAGAKAEQIHMQGIRIDSKISGLGLRYKVRLSDTGETQWMEQGKFAGVTSGNNIMIGFTIELTGESANKYKLSYKAAIENIGPTAFYDAGQYCGTMNRQFIDAIWLKLETK